MSWQPGWTEWDRQFMDGRTTTKWGGCDVHEDDDNEYDNKRNHQGR
jgi:hypothetical protein